MLPYKDRQDQQAALAQLDRKEAKDHLEVTVEQAQQDPLALQAQTVLLDLLDQLDPLGRLVQEVQLAQEGRQDLLEMPRQVGTK
jgi:hypothetical protein